MPRKHVESTPDSPVAVLSEPDAETRTTRIREPRKNDLVLLQVVGKDDRGVPTLCRFHGADTLDPTRTAIITRLNNDATPDRQATADLAVWNGFMWEKQVKSPHDPSCRTALSWHYAEEEA